MLAPAIAMGLFADVTLGGLVVEWQGPVSGPPIAGTDYMVTNPGSNPDILLITTEKDGVPVERWFIGNEDSGGNPLDINSITSAWSVGPLGPRDIRVEVGTAPRKCRHLGTMDIASEDSVQGTGHPTTWSGAILNLTGDLTGPLKVVSTAERLGGRVRRTIAGNQGQVDQVGPGDPRVEARAIGEGASTAGTLRVNGLLWNARFADVPASSRLEAGHLLRGYV